MSTTINTLAKENNSSFNIINNIKTINGNYLILTDIAEKQETNVYGQRNLYVTVYMDREGEFLCIADESEFDRIFDLADQERIGGRTPTPEFTIEVEETFYTETLEDDSDSRVDCKVLKVYNVEGGLIHEENID